MFPTTITADKLKPPPQERDALEPHGFVRIPLETGLNVGPVNVTLVKGETYALIDTALHHLDNLERLEASLLEHNVKLDDIGEIWLTHPHIDHFGLTAAIVERSGAKIFAPKLSKSRFDRYLEFWHSDRNAFLGLMKKCGVPTRIIDEIRASTSSFRTVASPFIIDHGLEQDETYTVAGRHTLIPIHSPGHTPWCSAFWFPDIGVMVCGDVLRQKMRFNLILYPAEDVNQEHQGYPRFRESLSTISDMPVKWMIPGHGIAFQNHQKTIRLAMRRQNKRKDLVLDYLIEEGPSTPYDVAIAQYTEAITERALLLIMSDIIALLDWLVVEGAAECQKSGDIRHYGPISS